MHTKRILKAAGQIGFSVAALALVFFKIDLGEFLSHTRSVDVFWLIAGMILLNIGQVYSGLRMRYYLHSIHVKMDRMEAIMLYYVGMFFNHLLPGGIGGDGYKVWYVRKHMQAKIGDAVRRVVSARANGLLALILLTLALAPFSPAVREFPHGLAAACLLAPLTLIVYYYGSRWLLKEPLRVQLGAFPYSFVIQFTNMLCAVALLYGLGITVNMTDYIMLFMVSCIASVIPISFGGAGLRELTFLYLAPFMQLNVEAGVALSLIYFIINILASLLGIVFFYRLKQGGD